MKQRPVISAVIPVWNGRAYLERLLATLALQTCPAAEILAVDNGSEDGAPEAAVCAGARVVSMGRNEGFAAAVNRGILESRGEWIAVLNSDVELTPEYFERLSATNGWFATGKILSSSLAGEIDATFDLTCRGGTTWRAGNGCPDRVPFDRPRRIWSAPWTAALFRAELFRKIGVLDQEFGSYLEDVDFGLRCAKAGCAGEYLPDAIARHHGSATLGRWHEETVRLIARNQVLLLARHYPLKLVTGWMWRIAIAHALWGAVAWKHGAARAWWRGKLQGLREYQSARKPDVTKDLERLERILSDQERLIAEMQGAASRDSYWRLYFLLTGGGAK